MDHYGRATKEAADGCENFLEITRFRYLHASTRLRCLWASWFLWWLFVAAPQGSLLEIGARFPEPNLLSAQCLKALVKSAYGHV